MTDPNIKETARIQLPVREPADKEPLSTATRPDAKTGSAAENLASIELSRLEDTPPPSSAAVVSAPEPSSELKTETARVLPTAEPVPSADQAKNAQPNIPMAPVVPQNSLIAATAAREKTSMLLSWILLAVSALILIIQIWIYLS